MDCGTEEIEDEEYACSAAKRAVDSEVGPRKQLFAEIFAPFDPKFEDPKADPEQPGDRAALDQTAGIVRLDERETRAEDETASQQDHGVDRSDREIGLPGRWC